MKLPSPSHNQQTPRGSHQFTTRERTQRPGRKTQRPTYRQTSGNPVILIGDDGAENPGAAQSIGLRSLVAGIRAATLHGRAIQELPSTNADRVVGIHARTHARAPPATIRREPTQFGERERSIQRDEKTHPLFGDSIERRWRNHGFVESNRLIDDPATKAMTCSEIFGFV